MSCDRCRAAILHLKVIHSYLVSVLIFIGLSLDLNKISSIYMLARARYMYGNVLLQTVDCNGEWPTQISLFSSWTSSLIQWWISIHEPGHGRAQMGLLWAQCLTEIVCPQLFLDGGWILAVVTATVALNQEDNQQITYDITHCTSLQVHHTKAVCYTCSIAINSNQTSQWYLD